MSLPKRTLAEFIGAYWLVFGGCGSAVLAAAYPRLGIGFAEVLAFGLTLLTIAYAIGHASRKAGMHGLHDCKRTPCTIM